MSGRIENSLKNVSFNIFSQLIIIFLGFFSRKIFIDNLGVEYLGINGLLTNVISMLSLVEGGIGTSIVYNLYKPLSEKDEEKIISLVQLYKKLYMIIAIGVGILSMCLYPFLGMLIKNEESIPFLGVVYCIFVIKNIISYLNAHKWSLINADQKGYILTNYNLMFTVITTISKIIVIQLTKNYVLYLVIELIVFVIQNLWNGRIVNQRYPYIKTRKKYKVSNKIKENMIANVKALFLHNVGSYCVLGTDNLLITAFVNLKTVGLYSNYTLITNQLSSLISAVLNGIGASVGNLIATENKDKQYEIFNITFLINFWIYSFSVICLYNLLENFITWAFGDNLLLAKSVFIFILINFYLMGLRSCILTFKTKAGIFTSDKFVPLIEAVINLIISCILGKYWGLIGIFIGTTISTLICPFWIQSKIVYNILFKKSWFVYLKKYIYYVFLTLITGLITTFICRHVTIGSLFINLVIKTIICTIIINGFYLVVFWKSMEFKYIKDIINNGLKRFKVKLLKIHNSATR